MIDIHHLSPWLLVIAPIVIVIAYTVFGLSGFGSTVITVPVLAHFLPVAYLVPLMVTLDLISEIAVGAGAREHMSKPELKRLIPFMFVGFLVGATLLVGVPDVYLRIALGAFSMAVGIHGILNPHTHRTISAWWCIPTGITGGAVATVFGAGGPVYASYLGGRLRDKSAIRATVSSLISISAFSRAAIYAFTGLLLHTTIFLGTLVLAPFVWIGLKVGTRIHVGLTQEQMRRVIGSVLVLTGGSLLVRALL